MSAIAGEVRNWLVQCASMMDMFSRITPYFVPSVRMTRRSPGFGRMSIWRMWQRCAFIFVLLLPLNSYAAEVSGLYETEVLVTSQGSNERSEAIRMALSEVLIRVSGDRNTPKVAALQGLYKRSLQLVQQYRYRTLPRVDGLRNDQGAGGQVAQQTQALWIRFDPAAIDQSLRKAGVPVWGQVRPATLAWVVIDDGQSRMLMGAETLLEPKEVMQQQAQRRGLPLFVPLWDLEDQAALRFTDVWGNFQDAILSASARYSTEAVLVGRLYQLTSGWEGRWTLYQGNTTEHWQASAPLQGEVLAAGVDGAADHLGRRFAMVFDESQRSRVKVIVKDIHSLEDYARAAQFLQSLDMVTATQVAQVVDTSVTFTLQVNGSSSALAQTISFGRTLMETPAVVNVEESSDPSQVPLWTVPDEPETKLWYRLLP